MNEIPYSPVVRQIKLPVQVAEQIQGLILAKQLKVGERLPGERDLCEQFKVSRTVIREAIRILEAKGLILSQGGSGTYVRGIQTSDVVDSLGMYIATQSSSIPYLELMEIRRVLEVQIAALAAERITEDFVEQLETMLVSMEATLESPEAFAQADLEFHMSLARATGNNLFEIILNPFIEPLYEGRRLSSEIPGVAQEAMVHHRKILDMVKAGDGEGASEAMLSHLEQSSRVILEALVKKSGEIKANQT
jgi:GntR family transcriptional regulator, transcriptional repressor for pyruvate dehydrogenase complex